MDRRPLLPALPPALRRAVVQDDIIALVLAGLSVAALWNPPPFVDFDFREPDAFGVALAVMGGASVAVRRRHPVAATLVALLAVVPLTQLGYSPGASGLAILLALYGVAADRRLRTSAMLLLLTVAVVGVVLATSPLAPSAGSWAANLFFIGTAWVFGRSVRVRRAHLASVGARNEAQAEALAARTRAMLVEERARVAREMQDLVAHTLSEVNVQVSAARRTLTRGDHASAEQLLRAAEEAGRAAMEETRRAVCVLGHCDDDTARRPQPGLADLDELLAREKATGTEVGLTSTGEAVAVPPGVALTSYRVVEAALAEGREEGPRSTAIGVDWRPDSLVVRVRTTPHTPRVRWHGETPARTGGLERLRTRVELYGGELHRARTRDGGSEVTARFPTVTGRTA